MAAGVIVAVALAAAVLLARGGDEEPAAGGCRLLTPPSGPPDGTGAGVRIVEQGHTRIVPGEFVSMGAVLRNTTGKVAYRTRVTFDVLDAAGNSVVWENHRRFMTQEIPVILPSTGIALGNSLALTESARPDPRTVARVSITFTVTRWLDPGDGNNGLGAVTTTVVPGMGERDDAGTGSVTFTANFANCAQMAPRGYSMIFRDAAGAVVGGDLSTDLPLDVCKPGGSGQNVALSGLLGRRWVVTGRDSADGGADARPVPPVWGPPSLTPGPAAADQVSMPRPRDRDMRHLAHVRPQLNPRLIMRSGGTTLGGRGRPASALVDAGNGSRVALSACYDPLVTTSSRDRAAIKELSTRFGDRGVLTSP